MDPLKRRERRMINLYEHQIVMLKRIPFLRGMTPWILKDFRSPRRTLPRIEDYFNHKGLVSDHGKKKKAFFVLQKYYRELEMLSHQNIRHTRAWRAARRLRG